MATEQGMPMWSEDRIFARLAILNGGSDDPYDTLGAAGKVMREMNDDYEQKLAALRTTIGERDRLIGHLSRQLDEAASLLEHPAQPQAQWTPVEDDWSYSSEESISLRVKHDGQTLVTTDYAVFDSPLPNINHHHLPSHIRLCQLTPVPQRKEE